MSKLVALDQSYVDTTEGEWALERMAEIAGQRVDFRDCRIMLIGGVLVVEGERARTDGGDNEQK